MVSNITSGFTYYLFNKINSKVIEWNLQPLIGKALFKKHESIAYIELKIYGSMEDNYLRSQVIWNVTDLTSLHSNFKTEIEKSFAFFVRYVSALKGEDIRLQFEVNDAALDCTAHRQNPFEYAANYALLDCFKESSLTFKKETVEILKRGMTAYLK
ncbi:hypothetical protein [Pedobacter sp.]|uniref:hypothetical protein n=1 Tax=Pedobacter sp. TaxID=1411316 RepID=UPI0031D6C2A7